MKVNINNTGFKRTVSVTPVHALNRGVKYKPKVLLQITSTWVGAKDPNEERVEFSGIINRHDAWNMAYRILEAFENETI